MRLNLRQPTPETKSVLFAILLSVLLALWLISGNLYSSKEESPTPAAAPQAEPLRVEIRSLQAKSFSPAITVQGQLLAHRHVSLRAQTSAQVQQRPVQLGQRVKKGDLLLQLQEDSRPAQLARAEAEVALRQAELNASQRLKRDNLIAETEMLRLQAALANAQAERTRQQQELEFTRIRAPFDGIIDQLPMEVGDMAQVGDAVAVLVDISTLKLQAQVPQQQVGQLQPGQPVEAILLDGRSLQGTLQFVASAALPATRSFQVEAHIDNPQRLRIAGASVTLRVALPTQPAHRLSPALLVLNNDNQLGVQSVDQNQHVRFLPLQLLSVDNDGAWAGGLPQTFDIIVQGGGFVSEGEVVIPVEQKAH